MPARWTATKKHRLAVMTGSDKGIFGCPRECDVGERVGSNRINRGSTRVHDTDRAVMACQVTSVNTASAFG
jgi:hypothetical protein